MTPTLTTRQHPLAGVVAQRRWLRRSRPFPHLVAYDVFAPAVYERIEASFRRALGLSSGQSYLEDHDIQGTSITDESAAEFEPLLSRPFHDLLSGLLGISATGQVACGIHHHRVGSAQGFPHNDLNPGWFDGETTPDRVQLARADTVDYTTGQPLAPGVRPVETIRAASVLFYLANPRWEPGDGGTTGLYANASDPSDRPLMAVPPLNNTLLAFECTPTSYHGFISNRRWARNGIVMWLHRPKVDVVSRWGAEAIVPYGRIPQRKDVT
jgi:hypothetical protein